MSAVFVPSAAEDVVFDPRGSIQATNVQEAIAETSGESGGASGGYEHVQSSPSATWTINHNLGRRVDVTLFTTGGVEFWAEILRVSDNQSIVYLATALAGRALVN